MLFVSKMVPKWPAVEEALRNLCSVFRNESWRREVIRLLKPTVPEVATLLKTFRGNLAKWRYEALHVVHISLLKLRAICEEHLIDIVSLFGDGFKDKEYLAKVRAACRWKDLWSSMAVFWAKIQTLSSI